MYAGSEPRSSFFKKHLADMVDDDKISPVSSDADPIVIEDKWRKHQVKELKVVQRKLNGIYRPFDNLLRVTDLGSVEVSVVSFTRKSESILVRNPDCSLSLVTYRDLILSSLDPHVKLLVKVSNDTGIMCRSPEEFIEYCKMYSNLRESMLEFELNTINASIYHDFHILKPRFVRDLTSGNYFLAHTLRWRTRKSRSYEYLDVKTFRVVTQDVQVIRGDKNSLFYAGIAVE